MRALGSPSISTEHHKLKPYIVPVDEQAGSRYSPYVSEVGDVIMKCIHKWKTVNTISRKAHREGSKKFKSGFEQAESHGIKILVARQKQCIKCGDKKTTVEISQEQMNKIYDQLIDGIDEKSEIEELSTTEIEVRNYLISVSKGVIENRHAGKAMYKEVWNLIYPSRQFGRGNTNEVVDWIVNISDFDTSHGRPPLNSLVVRGDTAMPGASWDEWKKYSNTPYKTVEKAQDACWSYWS